MNSEDAPPDRPTATETLAALVARRKASTDAGSPTQGRGRRDAERAAAARSLSRSKPASRK